MMSKDFTAYSKEKITKENADLMMVVMMMINNV